MPPQRKLRSDAPSSAVHRYASCTVIAKPPKGVEIRDGEERDVWDQFAAARSEDDWRAVDLVMLAKAVHIEMRMRATWATIDEDGMLRENAMGLMVKNPLIDVVNTLHNQQMTLLRVLALNMGRTDAETPNANGKRSERDAKAKKGRDRVSLLAV